MYCPKCGKENPEGQRFCPSCGLSLQTIVQAMDNCSSPASPSNDVNSISSRIFKNGFVFSLMLIFLGLFITALSLKLDHDDALHDIGMLIALLGVGLIGLKGLLMIVSQAGLLPQAKQQRGLTAKPQATLSPGEPLSVTEHTTRRLEAEAVEIGGRPRNTQPTLKS